MWVRSPSLTLLAMVIREADGAFQNILVQEEHTFEWELLVSEKGIMDCVDSLQIVFRTPLISIRGVGFFQATVALWCRLAMSTQDCVSVFLSAFWSFTLSPYWVGAPEEGGTVYIMLFVLLSHSPQLRSPRRLLQEALITGLNRSFAKVLQLMIVYSSYLAE